MTVQHTNNSPPIKTNSTVNPIHDLNTITINLSSNLVPFYPINITSDYEFQQAALTYGWPGTGNSGDPYIISNYLIDNDTVIGIYLESITNYFVIENVAINGSLGAGVYMRFCKNGWIKDSVIANITDNSGLDNGITLDNSSRITIQNTTLITNNIGINSTDNEYITILDNSLYYSNTTAIDQSTAVIKHDNYIAGNTVYYSKFGYRLNYWQGINNSILGNKALNNTVGFELVYSAVFKDNIASKNSMDGFDLTMTDNAIFENNTATENGVAGFYVTNVNYAVFINNKANNNVWFGISETNTHYLNITGNEFYNNSRAGITIQSSSGKFIIQNNTFQDNLIGIELIQNFYNIIKQNLFLNNQQYGLKISQYSSNNNIFMNEFKNSGQTGLLMDSGSFNNTIRTNYFINNSLNAQDNSNYINDWQGNYYSDYYGSIYYKIPGTSLAIDNLPRALDTDADGLPDYYEKIYGFNILVNDSYLDPDNDGLTNYQEFLAGTNPLVAENLLTSTVTTTTTVTETQTPISKTSVTNTTTVNTTVTTVLTLYMNSGSSSSSQIPTTNPLPGYELLVIIITLGIVIIKRKKAR